MFNSLNAQAGCFVFSAVNKNVRAELGATVLYILIIVAPSVK
jgi:hypothetical protein